MARDLSRLTHKMRHKCRATRLQNTKKLLLGYLTGISENEFSAQIPNPFKRISRLRRDFNLAEKIDIPVIYATLY